MSDQRHAGRVVRPESLPARICARASKLTTFGVVALLTLGSILTNTACFCWVVVFEAEQLVFLPGVSRSIPPPHSGLYSADWTRNAKCLVLFHGSQRDLRWGSLTEVALLLQCGFYVGDLRISGSLECISRDSEESLTLCARTAVSPHRTEPVDQRGTPLTRGTHGREGRCISCTFRGRQSCGKVAQ